MQVRVEELNTVVIGASNASKFFNTFWKNDSTIQFIYLPNLFEFDIDPIVKKLQRIEKPFRIIMFLTQIEYYQVLISCKIINCMYIGQGSIGYVQMIIIA